MLKIDMEPVKGILFVRLSGSLDKNTTKKLDNEVGSFLKKIGIKNIVFNINELEYIDKFGKNALLNSFDICSKNNGNSFLCCDDKKVLEKFKKSTNVVSDEFTALTLINL